MPIQQKNPNIIVLEKGILDNVIYSWKIKRQDGYCCKEQVRSDLALNKLHNVWSVMVIAWMILIISLFDLVWPWTKKKIITIDQPSKQASKQRTTQPASHPTIGTSNTELNQYLVYIEDYNVNFLTNVQWWQSILVFW